jgi:thioredoxin reductase
MEYLTDLVITVPEGISPAKVNELRALPGIFAVGDVRGGSTKHVVSAVGEGSIAISFVHKVLQE